MRTGRIDNYHCVFVCIVLEIVINALLLHQSTDKVEVGLTILNTVFVYGKGGASKFKLNIRAEWFKYFFENGLKVHCLKYPRITSTRKEPKPRTQNESILKGPLRRTLHPHRTNETMKVAFAPTAEFNCDAGRGTQEVASCY